MSYISHTGYTKMLKAFGKETSKGLLKEGLEKEGNAFTAGLAKTPKGGEFKVGSKKFIDRTNYDAPVKEEEVIDGEYGTENAYGYPYEIFYIDGEPYVESISLAEFSPLVYPKYKIAFKKDGQWVKAIVTDIKGSDRNHYEGLKLRIVDPGMRSDRDYRMDEAFIKEGDEEVDKKLEKIADLHKGKKIDFETIEKIAKALEGQGYEVNARYVQQFLSQHGVGMNEDKVDEYNYTDNYPGSWGYRENDEMGDFEEGLNPAPLQATGPTIITKESMGYNFSVLSPGERDQLAEYIKSIKTIKEEINKLVGKAKKGVEEGGDMTNLIMKELGPGALGSAGKPGEEAEYRKSLVKRRGPASPEEVEKKISPEMHNKVHKTLDALRAALEAEGLEGWEVEMFIKHEIEEKGKENIMGQYDF